MYGWLIVFVISIISLILYVYYFMYDFTFWKKRNVPHPKPLAFFGNVKDFNLGGGMVTSFNKMFEDYAHEKVVGLYNLFEPIIVVLDPEMIKQILVKHFDHFIDRSGLIDSYELLNQHFFSFRGEKWKTVRQKMTTIFSTNKLKNMFHLITEKGDDLRRTIEMNELNVEATDMTELMGRYAMDVIGSVGLGIYIDSTLDDQNPIYKKVRLGFEKNIFVIFRLGIKYTFTLLSKLLHIRIIPKELETFFLKTIRDIIQMRSGQQYKRNDFIDLMLQLKDSEKFIEYHSNKLPIDDKFITAHSFMFFIAGYETTSLTLSLLFYELALNLDIQRKLHKEIDDMFDLHPGILTYNDVENLTYLDMVLKETMRKYPVAPFLHRICTKAFTIPGTNIRIERKMMAVIPIFFIQRNPKYYPEPEKFIPERFTPEAIKQRNPMTYLPFGEGPRVCIGKRLANLQSKIGIISVMRDYEVEVCEKTTHDPQFYMSIFVMYVKGNIWLKLRKRHH